MHSEGPETLYLNSDSDENEANDQEAMEDYAMRKAMEGNRRLLNNFFNFR